MNLNYALKLNKIDNRFFRIYKLFNTVFTHKYKTLIGAFIFYAVDKSTTIFSIIHDI